MTHTDPSPLQLQAATGTEGHRPFPRAPQGHCDQPKNVLGSTPGSPLSLQGPVWTLGSIPPATCSPSLPPGRSGTLLPPSSFCFSPSCGGALCLSPGRLLTPPHLLQAGLHLAVNKSVCSVNRCTEPCSFFRIINFYDSFFCLSGALVGGRKHLFSGERWKNSFNKYLFSTWDIPDCTRSQSYSQ